MPSVDDSYLIIEIKIFSEKTIMPHHAANFKKYDEQSTMENQEQKSKSITFAYNMAKKKRGWSKTQKSPSLKDLEKYNLRPNPNPNFSDSYRY